MNFFTKNPNKKNLFYLGRGEGGGLDLVFFFFFTK